MKDIIKEEPLWKCFNIFEEKCGKKKKPKPKTIISTDKEGRILIVNE